MNSYELISEVYRILSQIDGDLIATARKQQLATEVDRILQAFGDAIGSEPRLKREVAQMPAPLQERLRPGSTEDVSGWRQRTGPPVDEVEHVFSRLVDSRRITSRQLVRLLNRSGLPIRFGPKDSRRKTIERAVRELENLPESKRLAILRRFHQLAGADETAGWMDVIRSFSKE